LPALAAPAPVGAWARPRPGPALDGLLDEGSALRVTASSRAVLDPRGRPQAAADGDLATAWMAESGDPRPTLRVQLGEAVTVSRVGLRTDPELAASIPLRVALSTPGGDRVVRRLGPSQVVVLPQPVRTDALTVEIVESRPIGTYDPYTDRRDILPVGVSEIVVNGSAAVAPSAREVIDSACGQGPELRVGDRVFATAVRATRQELLALAEAPVSVCADGPPVTAGAQTVALTAAPAWSPARMVVGEPGVPAEGPRWRGVSLDQDAATSRTLTLPRRSEPVVVSLAENANDGWQATLGGAVLPRLVVDGWRQGWIAPAGEGGELQLEFVPQRGFRIGLALGAVALIVLALVSLRRAGGGSPEGPPCPSARPGRADGWVTGALLVAMAGPAGAAAGLLAAAGWRWGRGAVRVVAVGVLAAGAALWWAAHPWGSADYAGASAGALLALLAALALAVWPSTRAAAPTAGPAAPPGPN
jgi:arabinofuranan 3-O-arabinosyltransferase